MSGTKCTLQAEPAVPHSPPSSMLFFCWSVSLENARLTRTTDGNIKRWKCRRRRSLQANSASRVDKVMRYQVGSRLCACSDEFET